jgi:hypothetical protein
MFFSASLTGKGIAERLAIICSTKLQQLMVFFSRLDA